MRWAPYVSVAERKRQAAAEAKKHQKNGKILKPIHIEGRKIVTTFWGNAWCEHLEKFSDFANRLPRGRSYARNGSVIHLDITKGAVEAMVSGSSLYKIKVQIDTLDKKRWKEICTRCSGSIHSLMDLMQGKLSSAIMEKLTDKDTGMFPTPKQIKLECSCPDWAYLCKHLAAVMYCIGHRLDKEPELLFVLRGVEQQDLISKALDTPMIDDKDHSTNLQSDDLGAMFGIELGTIATQSPKAKPKNPSKAKLPAKKTTAKETTKEIPKPKKKSKTTSVPSKLKVVKKSLPAKKITKKKVAKQKVAK